MNTEQSLAKAIIGTWKLISWTFNDEKGSVTDFFGPSPEGILMYDEHGYMNAQLMQQNRSPFISNALAGGTPDESKQALDTYLAYFGRYEINPENQTVTHVVEASLLPNWVGQEQIRYVQIVEDRLMISTPYFEYEGQHLRFQLEWQKVTKQSVSQPEGQKKHSGVPFLSKNV